MADNIQEWAGDGHKTVGVVAAKTGQVFGEFHPGQANRYGLPPGAGSTSGERGSLEALQEVIRSDANAFGIPNNKSYIATVLDLKDAQFLASDQKDSFGRTLSVYDALVPDAAAPATPPQPPATPGTPTPPAPFERMTDRELQEDMALKLNYLQAASMRIEAALARPQPQITAADDEGKALVALQSIRSAVGAFTRELGDRPAEGVRNLLKEILARVAEGGA